MWKTTETHIEEENPSSRMTLEVDTQLAFAPDLEKKTVRFTLQDTAVTMTETSKDGSKEKIGEIVGSMGGTIEIRDERAKETWIVRPLDLWKAFAKAKEGI